MENATDEASEDTVNTMMEENTSGRTRKEGKVDTNKKGQEVSLKEKVEDIKDAVVETVEDTKEAVEEKVQDIKDAVVEKVEDIKEIVEEKVEDIKEAVEESFEDFKEKVAEVKESIKETVLKSEEGGNSGPLVMLSLLGTWGSGYLAFEDVPSAVLLGGDKSSMLDFF